MEKSERGKRENQPNLENLYLRLPFWETGAGGEKRGMNVGSDQIGDIYSNHF